MLQYYQKKVRTTKAIAAKGIDYKWYRQQKVSETKGVDFHFLVKEGEVTYVAAAHLRLYEQFGKEFF